ncbi:MAG: hypothetical protein AB1847_03260 [bacterium]
MGRVSTQSGPSIPSFLLIIVTIAVLLVLIVPIGEAPSPCLAAEEGGEAAAAAADRDKPAVRFRGHLRADFSQYTYTGIGGSNWHAGMRCDLKSTSFLAEGLGMETDFRYRHYNSQWRSSLKSLYELAVFYRSPDHGHGGQGRSGQERDGQKVSQGRRQERDGQGIYLKVGRFNLYDLSGVGELDGGAAGWCFSKNFLAGLYLGCEPNLAEIKTDSHYQKAGLFLNCQRPGGLRALFSCNQIRFQGLTERTFLYGQAFLPLWKRVYSYQHIEYELGPLVGKSHLTRFFINTRLDVTQSISMTGSYYYGQGYDYHRMILENIKSGQTPSTGDLEPFYWYQNLGLRASLRLSQRQRIAGYASIVQKKVDGDLLPRYGGSYFIDGLLGDRAGGGIRLTRTMESQTVRNMLSVEVNGEINERLTVGLNYSNYTFEFVEKESTIISPPDSNEYNLNFQARINRQISLYGYIQYTVENDHTGDGNCWQDYLSLVYRL